MHKSIILSVVISFSTAFGLFGQTKPSREWFLTESNGGLCNESLLLFSDSTYCSESGCEASSRFSFGKWSQKKNIITFTPANTATFNFIQKVEREVTNDKKITVVLYDKYGENITDRIIVGQYVNGKGMYKLELDSTNTKRTDLKRDKAALIITTLQRFTKQRLTVEVDSSNIYRIYLNIPRNWNFHNNSIWEGNETFSLVRKDNFLTSLEPDRIEDWKLVHSKYIKQKE